MSSTDEALTSPIQSAIQSVVVKTQDLKDNLASVDDGDLKSMRELIEKHLKSCYNIDDNNALLAPVYPVPIEFNEQIQWIHTSQPRGNLHSDAASNLIVFDFFTHCCINCIHSIEDLRQVESSVRQLKRSQIPGNIQCGFKLISIHSPKFTTEKQTESIKSSVARMKMDHTEVLNDPDMVLWQGWGIYCWPTVLVFGPNINTKIPGPNLLFVLTGEGHKSFLKLASEVALDFFDRHITLEQAENYQKLLNTKETNVMTEVHVKEDQVDSAKKRLLNFPGKVCVFQDLICISDSGNNRIIIANLAGEIQHIIGGSSDGFQDGDFASARFYNPQGTAFKDPDTFVVADTGNHAIRMVKLSTKTVTTLVSPNQTVPEHETTLKSPWDLSFYLPNVLLIAAAGTHQIFGYFFDNTQLFGKTHEAQTFNLVAGSGREENRNNMYLLKSAFAQPSGIATVGNAPDQTVYLADSESSSIRQITPQGRVMALVGGNRDPTNLFTYGDEDGVSYDVKLQHPMGVCAAEPGKVFIADTYNHKVKMINVETKHCSTLIGDGSAGNKLGIFAGNVKPKRLGLAHPSSTSIEKLSPLALLNEPGGICVDENSEYLYIADTNNHSIKVGHLNEQIVSELLLKKPQDSKEPPTPKSSTGEIFDEQFSVTINKSVRNFNLMLKINKLPAHFEGGSWKIICPVLSANQAILTGSLTQDAGESAIITTEEDLPFVPWMREVYILLTILYCQEDACHRRNLKLLVNFSLNMEPQCGTDASFSLEYTPAAGIFSI